MTTNRSRLSYVHLNSIRENLTYETVQMGDYTSSEIPVVL